MGLHNNSRRGLDGNYLVGLSHKKEKTTYRVKARGKNKRFWLVIKLIELMGQFQLSLIPLFV